MTSLGLEPATFWLVLWCLNQIHYRAPQLLPDYIVFISHIITAVKVSNLTIRSCTEIKKGDNTARQYSEKDMDCTTKESGFDSRQEQKRFFPFSVQYPDSLLRPLGLLYVGNGAVSLGVKWLEPEADHSPPASAKVKNGGAIPPFPCTSS
jgi:hypothetical protein